MTDQNPTEAPAQRGEVTIYMTAVINGEQVITRTETTTDGSAWKFAHNSISATARELERKIADRIDADEELAAAQRIAARTARFMQP